MSNNKNKQEIGGFLGGIERIGNALPHPVVIFIILAVITLIISHLTAGYAVNFFDAKANAESTVEIVSLLNPEGIRYIFESAIKNFTGFAPLGVVLVAMLGIGVAEQTGLLGSFFSSLLLNANRKIVTAAVVFIGVVSNLASDAGYVVVVPMGGIVFALCGMHPIAGIAAAFAGVSGGFSANLMFGPTDVLLMGISNSALEMTNSDLLVKTTDNWYFLMASTFFITIVGTIITDKIVLKNLGPYKGLKQVEKKEITEVEKRGLRNALIVLVIFLIVMAFLTIPENALFRTLDEKTGKMTLEKFMGEPLIIAVVLLFMLPGLAYGITTKTIQSSHDFVACLTKSMEGMAGFIIMAFFSSQFIAYFTKTNLGIVIAVKGAEFLKAIGLTGIPLIVLFILLTAFINLFIGSASAKWGIMAPIFLPMFMEVGLSPALTQAAYRIADSSTNIISPLMNYFAVIVVFMQSYDKDSGLGTLISTMLPYSLAFLVTWILLLVIWMIFQLPLGPETLMFI